MEAKFEMGQEVESPRGRGTIVGIGPWKPQPADEHWYTVRTTPERFPELRKPFPDFREHELTAA